MEKYKKKLQEGADLRQHVKVHPPSTHAVTRYLTPTLVFGKAKCRSDRQECDS